MRRSARRAKRPSNWLGRLLTGLIIGLGIGALILSFAPAVPAPPSPPAALGGADLSQPALPAQASRASDFLRSGSGGDATSAANPLEQPTPRPIIRAAAPVNAPAAVDVRAIDTGRASEGAAAPPPAPFSVVVAVEDDDAMRALGLAIVGGLRQTGVSSALLPLEEAGRPDVILALGRAPAGRNEAWFCEPGPAQSIVLATELLAAIGAGEDDAATAQSPNADFPCEDIHAGRARVPAVLLEVGESGASTDPALIVNALRVYYATHRGAVLAARSAPRLTWPAFGPVTSHYDTSHPLGIDIGQWEGPIVSATDGVVSFAGGDACCSYGLHVIIESGDGLGTLYGHLSSLAVTQGQRIRQGDVLGEVGCTGTCFGTHLHFEVWLEGHRQNPMEYLD